MNESTGKTSVRPSHTGAQRYYADFMMDVLVYTVVLNPFLRDEVGTE